MTAPTITEREMQIIKLLAFEHSSSEISSKLYISDNTVKTHRKKIFQKLQVKNVAGLVRVAFERQLLQISV